MRRTITTALTALLMCSCIYEDLSDCPNYNGCPGSEEDSTAVTKAVPVEFTVSTWADSTATRSSISASEDAVQDINLYAYHEGVLESSTFLESPKSFTMTLYTGRTYNLYALANIGEVEAPDSEEELLDYRYSVNAITDISGSLPMAWTDQLTVSSSAPKAGISLERLLSRIRFSIDKSQLEDFEITSARLCQGALGVHPFQSDCKAESTDEVGNGDYASTSDLQALNASKEITFYALENCQGTLLPGNADPTSKVPDEIPDHSALCTYLEMTASYSGEYQGVSVSSDNVTYRFYLGEDNCSDFNVRRNRDVSINLTVTEDRIFDESWRVSYGEDLPTVSYGLENSKSSASLKVGGTTSLSALYYKLVDGSRVSESDMTSYAAWSTSNSGVATVSGGKITAVSAGTATITATYNGYKATTTVTVSNTMSYSLVLNKTSLSVQEGSSSSLTATYITYTNGEQTSSKDVTSSATWSTSASSVASVSKGTVTGVSAGSATVTASYSGYKATCAVTVTEKPITYTYALKVTLSDSSIDVGGTTTAKATYITYADGVESSSKDVTSSATWTSGTTSVATVSSGTVSGKAAGTSAIKATYNGYSASATVTVSDVITYGMSVSLSSSSIYAGSTTAATATYITYTNGTKTSSKDVTSSATWTSSSSSVASVSSGTVTGKAAGTATISATYSGVKGSATITVTAKPVTYTYALVVSITDSSIEVGDNTSAKATYITYADGVQSSTKDVTSSATWSSSDASIATVSSGTVTAKATGSATISASYSGYSDDVSVTVSNKITYTLKMSPTSVSMQNGKTSKFTAVYNTFTNGVQTYGQDVSTSSSWTSSNTSVVTVGSNGLITAVGVGKATITAKYNGFTVTGSVNVTPAYTYELVVSPSTLRIYKGGTGNLTATYKTYADGVLESSVDVTASATWSSSSTSVATVSSGTVTAKSVGTSSVSAAYGGYSASASVTVVSSPTLSVGWTSQYLERGDVITNAAIYHPNDGTASYNVTSSATWTTSNSGVATVGGGTITAQGKGTATITATYNGVSASCTVTVTDNDTPSANAYVSNMSVQSVNISGTSNYKLRLTLTFSDGTVVEDAQYTWSVSYAQNSNIATGTSGDGPLIYTGGGTTYTMAVVVTTTDYYYDSSGNYRKWSTGTSFSHNAAWEP